MTFPLGQESSKIEWSLSESLPQVISNYKDEKYGLAPKFTNSIFGRKISNCSIDEHINGMNLIVLGNLSETALKNLSFYASNFKRSLVDNLGWKDKILSVFGLTTDLTSKRISKLDSLIQEISYEKKRAFSGLRENQPDNTQKLDTHFKKLGLPATASGFEIYKASTQDREAYNAIVKAKKLPLPLLPEKFTAS